MKLLTVVGARPQFIKAAVVSRAIEKHNAGSKANPICEIIVHTGQHYDDNMSEIFFREMHIPKPTYNLGLGSSLHGAMTGQMLEKLEEVMIKEEPDIVMVYGDTNSTLAGALAAAKLHIPVTHVEAGLRSFNMDMPEEINRIMTDRISRWLFCPTQTAIDNLENEGFAQFNYKGSNYTAPKIVNVGDVMYDAALYYQKIAQPSAEMLSLLEWLEDGFYLATIHRAGNTDNLLKLSPILKALENIAARTPVILPLHPRTKKIFENNKINTKNVKVINPVGYFDMITLLSKCRGVFTDSGGVQKEAYFFGKPCVTLREETEWTELVENGINVLVGCDYDKIVKAEEFIRKGFQKAGSSLYGDGAASSKIIQILVDTWAGTEH